MHLSRRHFALMALLASPAGAMARKLAPARRDHGVPLGIQTYSFREFLTTPGDVIDRMIAGCHATGITMVELFEPSIQPPAFNAHAPWAVVGGKPTEASLFGRPPEGPPPAERLAQREEIRSWRLNTDLAHFHEIGQRFRRAGITVQAFNFSLKEDCTDAEVERGFQITKALGTDLMTASTTIRMAQRTVPFAQKHQVKLGLHGHSNLHDPNQFATPESFEQGLAMSPLYKINFDIGHFAAAGFDVLAFLEKHHARTVSVHLKDRKLHDGANEPFGQGDTPIAACVRMIRDRGYNIPAFLEYEYAGTDCVSELRRMKAFVEHALA